MLITGARGMAMELFEILHQNNYAGEIFFYDDVAEDAPKVIYGSHVLRHISEAEELFKRDNNFILGLGNPLLRRKMNEKFSSINGQLNTLISPLASIGKFGNTIGEGCNIMTGVTITNNVSIGKGVLINVNASISHDCIIGDFTEISPGAVITGRCTIGEFSVIGSHATILPDVKIGKHAIVGAGAVVTKDVDDNTLVIGVPAKARK